MVSYAVIVVPCLPQLVSSNALALSQLYSLVLRVLCGTFFCELFVLFAC